MRDLINLVESTVDIRREEEFSDNIDRLLWDAQDLERRLKALNVAPSMQERLNGSMKVVTDYLGGLSKHARGNLRR